MEPDRDARMWAMFTHLAALAALTPVPLAHILGPLVVWLIKRGDDPFVDEHGKESLNFQITVTLYLVGTGVLVAVLGIVGLITGGLGTLGGAVLLLFVIVVYALVMVVVAAVRANAGSVFRYPFTLRFVR